MVARRLQEEYWAGAKGGYSRPHVWRKSQQLPTPTSLPEIHIFYIYYPLNPIQLISRFYFHWQSDCTLRAPHVLGQTSSTSTPCNVGPTFCNTSLPQNQKPYFPPWEITSYLWWTYILNLFSLPISLIGSDCTHSLMLGGIPTTSTPYNSGEGV